MTTFIIHNANSAPAGSKELLGATQRRKGLIPNLYGVLAEAPIAVEAYDALGSLLMRSSFTPTERHVVWFTINAYHDCHYCMAAHIPFPAPRDGREIKSPRKGVMDYWNAAMADLAGTGDEAG